MKRSSLTLATLRQYAVARSLFAPTSLTRAIERLGFVQADPIRAPARAQDLTLRHRVRGYRAGDLERSYPKLAIEEDFFVNYGFLPRNTYALMHPRTPRKKWSKARLDKANAVLEFVRARGVTHPRDVDAHFQHGKVRNWFGGSTNASTQLLDEMHYRGLVRIAARESGTRLYAAHETPGVSVDADQAMDALIDTIVRKYAPLPERSLTELVRRLRGGVPQWERERGAALKRAHARLPSAELDGVRWLWPEGESPLTAKWRSAADDDTARLLAPFDPVVWDRRRFELFWNWSYRFEAYTPAAKRLRGFMRSGFCGAATSSAGEICPVAGGQLKAELGYVTGVPPSGAAFKRALDEELLRMERFLGLA